MSCENGLVASHRGRLPPHMPYGRPENLEHALGVVPMKVAEGMSRRVLTIGPAHTLREAARMMAARRVGAAVVVNPEHSGVGILTERDILNSVAAGESPDT